MTNILLTGGSGFIGKNLYEQLRDRYNIFAPRHKELDILDFESLHQYVQENEISVVIHAAVHVPAFNGYDKEFFNDMQMFWNLEKMSRDLDRIVYFGSGAEFDKRYDIRNVVEEQFGEHIPVSEYGLAKYTMNRIARTSNNIYNLRLFGVFGKYELWQIKFLSNLCCKAVYGLPLTIRKDCYFNFLYIDDLVKITDSFININPDFHDYNACHDNEYLLSDLAKMIVEISGKQLDVVMLSDERNLDYSADNSRLRNELKDLEITPMKRSLELLYQYYLENKDIIDYETLKETR